VRRRLLEVAGGEGRITLGLRLVGHGSARIGSGALAAAVVVSWRRKI
jgi:hypothetical protein